MDNGDGGSSSSSSRKRGKQQLLLQPKMDYLNLVESETDNVLYFKQKFNMKKTLFFICICFFFIILCVSFVKMKEMNDKLKVKKTNDKLQQQPLIGLNKFSTSTESDKITSSLSTLSSTLAIQKEKKKKGQEYKGQTNGQLLLISTESNMLSTTPSISSLSSTPTSSSSSSSLSEKVEEKEKEKKEEEEETTLSSSLSTTTNMIKTPRITQSSTIIDIKSNEQSKTLYSSNNNDTTDTIPTTTISYTEKVKENNIKSDTTIASYTEEVKKNNLEIDKGSKMKCEPKDVFIEWSEIRNYLVRYKNENIPDIFYGTALRVRRCLFFMTDCSHFFFGENRWCLTSNEKFSTRNVTLIRNDDGKKTIFGYYELIFPEDSACVCTSDSTYRYTSDSPSDPPPIYRSKFIRVVEH